MKNLKSLKKSWQRGGAKVRYNGSKNVDFSTLLLIDTFLAFLDFSEL